MRISDWSSDVCSSDLFNKASLLIESRSWGQQRLVAIGLTLMIIVALAVGMTIFTAAGYVVGYLRENIEINAAFWGFVIAAARWIILFGIYFLTVSILYKFGPASSRKWKLFSPGDRKSTRLNSSTNAHLVCRLLLENKNKTKRS